MGLTADHQATLLRHINTKWANKACPRCHANNWQPHGYVQLAVSPDAGNAMVIGSGFLPCAAIICLSCGYTELMNLVIAGVLSAQR